MTQNNTIERELTMPIEIIFFHSRLQRKKTSGF